MSGALRNGAMFFVLVSLASLAAFSRTSYTAASDINAMVARLVRSLTWAGLRSRAMSRPLAWCTWIWIAFALVTPHSLTAQSWAGRTAAQSRTLDRTTVGSEEPYLIGGVKGGRLAVADFDGDGKGDVAAIVDGALRVYSGDGKGNFAQIPQSIPEYVIDVVSGEFTGSGRQDLLIIGSVTDGSSLGLYVLRNLGKGKFGAAMEVVNAALPSIDDSCRIAAGTFTTKHKTPIDFVLSCSMAPTSLFLGINKGDGQFDVSEPVAAIAPGRVIEDVSAGDVDGDGLSEVLVTSVAQSGPANRSVDLLWNSASGFRAQRNVISAKGLAILTDYDGDGFADILAVEDARLILERSKGFEFETPKRIERVSGCKVESASTGNLQGIEGSLALDIALSETCAEEESGSPSAALVGLLNTAGTRISGTINAPETDAEQSTLIVDVKPLAGEATPVGSVLVTVDQQETRHVALVNGSASLDITTTASSAVAALYTASDDNAASKFSVQPMGTGSATYTVNGGSSTTIGYGTNTTFAVTDPCAFNSDEEPQIATFIDNTTLNAICSVTLTVSGSAEIGSCTGGSTLSIGTHTIGISFSAPQGACSLGSAPTVTVTKASQAISFTAPASPVIYGVSPIALSATASSGLAIAFSVTSGTCTVSGNTLTVTGAGTCVVAANQGGDDAYSPAAQVTQSVTVNKAAMTVTASGASRAYGVSNPTFSYTLTGYVNGDTSSVVGGSAAETTSATSTSAPGSYSITFSSEALTATNYTFSYVSGTLTVSQASQTISFNAPASPVTYGVSPISLSATASSGLVVTFSVSSGPCSVSGATLTVTGAGTCVVAANQAGNSDYSAAAQVTQSVTVNAAVLTVTANSASRVYGVANPGFNYTVTGYVNGDTSSVVGGSAAETTSATSTSAPGSYSITFSSEALTATNYTFSYVNGTLTVSQASQTITFNAPASPVTYGVSPSSLSATASSGLAVTFSVSSGPCSVSASTLTVTGSGTCVVTANQAGNADYSAAAAVSHSIVVNAALLTVTANNVSRAHGAANPSFTASYSGFVNGDTSSVLSGAPSLTTTATTTSAPGTYTITAAAGTLAASNYTFSFTNGTLTVGPAITTQPVSQTIADGSTATFSMAAAGVANLTYQWRYLSGTTWKPFGAGIGYNTATLTTFATTAAYNGLQLQVVVTDGNGLTVTSNVVTLTVNKQSAVINSTSSLSPSVYGDEVVWTFAVTGTGVTPTGSVTVMNGENPLATVPLSMGTAIYNSSVLDAGSHTLTAVYSGDNNYY